MNTSQPPAVHTALNRLAARPPQAAEISESDLPVLLREPSVVILWLIGMLTVVALVALARVRVPYVVRGTVATVTGAEGRQTLLLLPPSARSSAKPGQRVSVDTGGVTPVMLRIERVETALLDARRARSRYPASAGVLVHVATPKMVAHVSSCHAGECLTTENGVAYPATAAVGARTLASYVVPDR